MTKQFWTLIYLSFTVLTANAESAENIIQKKLAAIHSMQAEFAQTVFSKQRVISQSSGQMFLVRPKRFRWQTKQPMAQTLVADGKQLWIYDVDLEQVTITQQNQNLGAAGALFLSNNPNAVEQNFKVTLHRQANHEVFDLRAKSSKSHFDRVKLYFKQENLTKIELDDQLGQHTTIRLSNIKLNQAISSRLFQFKVPAGVDVVHQ